ncbi:MAG: putative quinol monooxygenase [Pseudomonadota bacterium]
MFAVVVTLKIAPGKMPDFLTSIRPNAAASLRDEPGCHRFDVCHDDARPNEVFLYELYDDAAAFDAHLATEHFKIFDAETAPMIVGKDIRTYEQVFP